MGEIGTQCGCNLSMFDLHAKTTRIQSLLNWEMTFMILHKSLQTKQQYMYYDVWLYVLEIQYVAKSIGTCKKKFLHVYNQPKPYFLK